MLVTLWTSYRETVCLTFLTKMDHGADEFKSFIALVSSILALPFTFVTYAERVCFGIYLIVMVRKIKSVDMQGSSLSSLVEITVHKIKVFGFV